MSWPAWHPAATLAPRFISSARHQAAAYLLASWGSRGQVLCQSDHAETSSQVRGRSCSPHQGLPFLSYPAEGRETTETGGEGRGGRVARSVEKFSCTGGAGVVSVPLLCKNRHCF